MNDDENEALAFDSNLPVPVLTKCSEIERKDL